MVAAVGGQNFLIESGYGGVYFRSEVDVRLYCEMFDDLCRSS